MKITKLEIMLIAIGKIQSEMMGMSIRKLYEYLTQCKGSRGSPLTGYVSGWQIILCGKEVSGLAIA